MENIEILRLANLLIRNHGREAIKAAAMQEVEMLQRGDEEGAIVWQKTILAIDKLLCDARQSQIERANLWKHRPTMS